MSKTTKIKVTVITGFLGAGKTTFINALLKENRETQFALVENEFGEISIDTKLIKGVDASQMFELKQGCICCTISDEFELVLQELAERFPNVEHLLIETTGIADPAPVIRPFFSDKKLKEVYKFNGTICLADALNFSNSAEQEITIKQLVVADLVLISKSENLSKKQKEGFCKKLQKVNPFAKILLIESETIKTISLDKLIRKNRNEFDFIQFSNLHLNIISKSLSYQSPLNKVKFLHWLDYTLDINKSQIYRTKGIICFENEPYEFILQGVGGSFELIEGDNLASSKKSFITFIGIDLPEIRF